MREKPLFKGYCFNFYKFSEAQNISYGTVERFPYEQSYYSPILTVPVTGMNTYTKVVLRAR